MRPLLAALAVALASAASKRPPDFPILPGVDRLGVGYDAVFGVSRGLPVVDLTSVQNGRTFQNPFTKTTFRVPDQAHVHLGTAHKSTTRVYHTSRSYAADRSLDVSASVTVGPWLSMSADVRTAHETLAGGDKVLSETRQRTVVYETAVVPPELATLAPAFLRVAASLPRQYNATAYKDFILYYGTHVVVGASLGGETKLAATVTSSYFSEHNDVDIGVQTSIKWLAFSAGAKASHDAQSSSSWSKSQSSFLASSVGGNPALDWTNDYGSWAKSVLLDPGVVSVSLEPLSLFIQDANISANLDTAIEAYRASYPVPTDGGAGSASVATVAACASGNLVYADPAAGKYGFQQVACLNTGKFMSTWSAVYGTGDSGAPDVQWVDTGSGVCCSPAFSIDNVPAN